MSTEVLLRQSEGAASKPGGNLQTAEAKIQSLQHLRVLAASVIVLYHTELQITRLSDGHHAHSFGFGAAGTDLFFVIGGFIMVYTQRDRVDTFGGFMYRRLLRIAPLYWLFTFLMLLVLVVAPSHLMTSGFEPWHFLFSLAFVPYPHPVLGVDRPFLFPGWVLNHFVFFYVIFGALLPLPVRRRVLAASAVLLGLMTLRLLAPGEGRLLDFYGATINLDFILGMIVGWLFIERRVSLSTIVVVGVLGLSVFAAGVFEDVSGGDDRALYWGVSSAALLFVCVFVEKQWNWLKWRLVAALGETSYSVFVSHLFALALVTSALRAFRLFPILGVGGTRFVFLAAAWIVAIGVYYVLERPLLNRLRRRSPKQPRETDNRVAVGPPAEIPISSDAA